MASTKYEMERLAKELASNYSLTETDLEALAEELVTRQRNKKYGRPFNELMTVICDVDQEVPDDLAMSEENLSRYSADELELIVLALEIRFWYGTSLRLAQLDNFACWTIVFSVPRQIQRTLVFKSDIANVELFVHGNGDFWKQGWTQLLPRYFMEDFGSGYMDLRSSRFPGGIDDALDAFSKHYNELKEASQELERRLTLFGDKVAIGKFNSDSANSIYAFAQHPMRLDLTNRCLSHCMDITKSLSATLQRAKRWKKGMLLEREMLSLPGAMNGFRWGGNLSGDFDRPNGPIVVGKQKITEARHSLLQLRVGSPWCEALKNPGLIDTWQMLYHPTKSMFPRHRNEVGDVTLQLPIAAYAICRYIKDKDQSTNLDDMVGEKYDPEKTESEIETQGKQMSANSGMPYWKVRHYRVDQGSSRKYDVTDLDLAAHTRKVHDAAGNLTLDFMAAMVEQVTLGWKPAGYRCFEQTGLFHGDLP